MALCHFRCIIWRHTVIWRPIAFYRAAELNAKPKETLEPHSENSYCALKVTLMPVTEELETCNRGKSVIMDVVIKPTLAHVFSEYEPFPYMSAMMFRS